MSLLKYWPTIEEINRCVKTEAENASDEVLLAVHQQFPLAYLRVGPDGKAMPGSREVASEDDMLNYFISEVPSGSHVVPITGASGVGKSHLIRILDARLRRMQNSHRYLIIRIPKSASLRRVIEMILDAEPLRNKKYQRIKMEFTKAMEDIPLDEAVIRFQSELDICLKEYEKRLKQELEQDLGNSFIRQKLKHAKELPRLFSDHATIEHFRHKVLPRIIQRTVKGVDSINGEFNAIDPTKSMFKIEDLDLSDIDWGQAAPPVASYYRQVLLTRQEEGKVVAIDVLNSVVDQAAQQLYRLNQALGGMTLSEVILEIRRLLLADNRELVLLVEDFAALVGIQDTLASVLIQEGSTSKGKEYATIRSAIAVTDGFWLGRDTLATRAGREWVVESRLESEKEALRRTKMLVASYINAARIGESGLKKHYASKSSANNMNDLNWLPPIYSDEDERDDNILHAFGYVAIGDKMDIPIFPFTEFAIECLAHSPALTSGNAILFNPRYIIKNIIREVLVSGRDAFEKGQYPPIINGAPMARTAVAQWLSSRKLSDDQKKRYERLVTVWGNAPEKTSEIGNIPKEVFDAFKLPRPDIESITGLSRPTTLTPKPIPISVPLQQSEKEQLVSKYQEYLEEWVLNDIRLNQNAANKIRQALSDLINRRIDWMAERYIKRDIGPDRISIYHAAGEQGIAANAIKICSTNKDPDGNLRRELLSLLRYYHVYEESNNYEGVDEDIVWIENLIERLLPLALDITRSQMLKLIKSTLLALIANSGLLGVAVKSHTVHDISFGLFGNVSEIEPLPVNSPQCFIDYYDMQCSAIQIRPRLQQLLMETSGCYQGVTGKRFYGVDIVRLVDCFPNDTSEIDYTVFPVELKQSLVNIGSSKVAVRVGRVYKEADKIKERIEMALGREFDKQHVIEVLRNLTDTLKQLGAWSNESIGCSANEFRQMCEEFSQGPIKESLVALKKIIGKDNDKINAHLIAKISLAPLVRTDIMLDNADKIVSDANKHAHLLESQLQGIDSDKKAKEITGLFDSLVADLITMQNGANK